MCFLTVFLLRRLVSLGEFEKLLRDLGFETVVRGNVLEARKGDAKLEARLERDKLRIGCERGFVMGFIGFRDCDKVV
ncbi:MAG: hypothetical protein JHC33_06535 [Ignisphaera sp.]|nr:hypothetical protein [Ignisphaera sp.]